MASNVRIVLITGGNTGIGYETVKALLKSDKHYHVLLGGRNIDKAKEAARRATSEIESKSKVEPLLVDVSCDESIQQAFGMVSSSHSHIDCLINNAGKCDLVLWREACNLDCDSAGTEQQ